ncbi:MAG: sigma-54 dependent transcriptional regulator [Deltaproteobacteria bacterium]|jgi:DNA-binding NtrC family response regulator|nr:sigma-54 dependent transcriptional regulator [Deltaproteobacteria bacterium]
MRFVLVVAQEQDIVQTIRGCFGADCKVNRAADRDDALEMLGTNRYDLVFLDLEILQASLADKDYKTALKEYHNLQPSLEIVVMAPQAMVREAVKAVKAGASDYITYPVDPEEVTHVTETINEAIILQSELDYLRDRFWQSDYLDLVKTKSLTMKEVFSRIRSVAPTKSTVLLIGETGTGKGLIARLIHQHSNRREAQFISVHCGAIPDTLIESELFGHEKGAFTGAIRKKLGKFEIAKGGTIFLDEIGTITPSAQIKLLQVLQDGTFQRVGGEETIQANARVITATNMDLTRMCDDGEFRKDLYYRLNVFPVEIPPLRERKEDIFHIAQVILDRLEKFNKKHIRSIHSSVMDGFMRYTWPGNVRELENLLERAYILENSSVLTEESFPADLLASQDHSAGVAVDASLPLAEVRNRGVEEIERRYLRELLASNRGRIKESAEVAGVSTRQLHKLLNKYQIRKEEFKQTAR